MQDIESTSYILPPEACVSNQFYIKEKRKKGNDDPHILFIFSLSGNLRGNSKSLTNQTVQKLVANMHF